MVVGEAELWERMSRPVAERLLVTPLLSPEQVRGGSIDVRLGQEFILMKRSARGPIDPLVMDDDANDYQERVRVPIGGKMILHPNQLVLGATLEFLQVPNDLMAYVIGRSSWGRLGLIVATAVMVSPGYRGSLTLELANLGDTPVYLYPGTRIAQLVFHTVTGAGVAYAQQGGKYTGPVGPEFSKLSLDRDWRVIRALAREYRLEESRPMD
ncbi:deoxycytidine triphosphate deaminase [Sulfobacillus acidophilus TPY]|uniref:dCTP deaminase n=1 Tax=Sulfobacillus acidophilus (strain ATCC 700253 / DSM 10332 / NAL) TaxID=679936 RepID=G8U1M2_SULAD|nr:deoxycytidine triphosphate deaminase [Sulfobacillus acidophilus TPY]AEW06627.1 dCTP deaminase [Sulfobacillus acidophilus DSM 10332]